MVRVGNIMLWYHSLYFWRPVAVQSPSNRPPNVQFWWATKSSDSQPPATVLHYHTYLLPTVGITSSDTPLSYHIHLLGQANSLKCLAKFAMSVNSNQNVRPTDKILDQQSPTTVHTFLYYYKINTLTCCCDILLWYHILHHLMRCNTIHTPPHKITIAKPWLLAASCSKIYLICVLLQKSCSGCL
jgi:hypothetical protein